MSDLDEYYAEQDMRMNIDNEELDRYLAQRLADRNKAISNAKLENQRKSTANNDKEPKARKRKIDDLVSGDPPVPTADSQLPSPTEIPLKPSRSSPEETTKLQNAEHNVEPAHKKAKRNEDPAILKAEQTTTSFVAHKQKQSSTAPHVSASRTKPQVPIKTAEKQPSTSTVGKRTAEDKISPKDVADARDGPASTKEFKPTPAPAVKGLSVASVLDPIEDPVKFRPPVRSSPRRPHAAASSIQADDSISQFIPRATSTTAQLRGGESTSRVAGHTTSRTRDLLNNISDPRFKHEDVSIVTSPEKSSLIEEAISTAPDPQSAGPASRSRASPSTSKKNKNVAVKPLPKASKTKKPVKDTRQYTPLEYAQKLQEKLAGSKSDYLKDRCIFYTGGDWKNATDGTKKKMEYIINHGGTLVPNYDPSVVTHIVTDAGQRTTLKALGLKSLRDIPENIPIVKWSWVIAGPRVKNYDSDGRLAEDNATFASRIYDPNWEWKKNQKAKGKGKAKDEGVSEFSGDISRISSEFTLERPHPSKDLGPALDTRWHEVHPSSTPSQNRDVAAPGIGGSSTSDAVVTKPAAHKTTRDPLAEFYDQAKAELDDMGRPDDPGDESDSDVERREVVVEPAKGGTRRGWACDGKVVQQTTCPNQDIVAKLEELQKLHKSKPSDDDHWRTYSYGKSIPAIKRYPKRIESLSEARSIRGVGDKTALKIMEILKTGGLERIKYENTEDVEATRIFQGIYGVGQKIAFQWYASGCRTLDDVKARKGGIKLSTAQEIGLRFYDDINDRMPRNEAERIFNLIQPIALSFDPKLIVKIMGSFRRGKADCGDIDILITRPVDDGKTHSGILSRLLPALHEMHIITEDLNVPDDWNDLETIYRGLCHLPNVAGARRRRIDFLTVPWECRGAALLYYTGDDIFNRSMRLKANSLGYSLNQRGLYGGVVRDPRDRRVKFNDGNIIASEREEDIFEILGVPWQEPHERVRG